MNTRTICISAQKLYEGRQYHMVRDLVTGTQYLLSPWGSYRVIESDNHSIRGERVHRRVMEVPNVD
jgi:hypothetical protein